MKEEFVLFWGGPFSQWHSSLFEIDGVRYNCAEQYMMREKARLFKDVSAEKEIMHATSPRDQKAWGQRVQGFQEETWNKVAKKIVFKGNVAKFTQNEELKQTLLDTGDKTLVEASPHDKIWGIGLGEDDPRAKNRSQWRGKNWLGEVLMDVRKHIRSKGL